MSINLFSFKHESFYLFPNRLLIYPMYTLSYQIENVSYLLGNKMVVE